MASRRGRGGSVVVAHRVHDGIIEGDPYHDNREKAKDGAPHLGESNRGLHPCQGRDLTHESPLSKTRDHKQENLQARTQVLRSEI